MSSLSYRSTAISLRSVSTPAEASIISINDLSYREASEVFNIPTLYDRRQGIGNSMLYRLLPPPYLGTLRTRKNRKFQVPRFKTNRLETVLL